MQRLGRYNHFDRNSNDNPNQQLHGCGKSLKGIKIWTPKLWPKRVASKLVSNSQNTFVEGRKILTNDFMGVEKVWKELRYEVQSYDQIFETKTPSLLAKVLVNKLKNVASKLVSNSQTMHL